MALIRWSHQFNCDLVICQSFKGKSGVACNVHFLNQAAICYKPKVNMVQQDHFNALLLSGKSYAKCPLSLISLLNESIYCKIKCNTKLTLLI